MSTAPASILPLRSRFTSDARAILLLGGPLIVNNLAIAGMQFTDTVFAGQLGARDLAAVAVGSAFYMFFFIGGLGLLMAMSPLVAHAYGAGDNQRIGKLARQALWLSQIVAFTLIVPMLFADRILAAIGIAPEVIDKAGCFVRAICFGFPAVMAFLALRFVSEGIGWTRPIIYTAMVALASNVVGCYVFMYGNWGAPELGAAAVGLTGVIVAVLHLVMIVAYVQYVPELRRYHIFARLFHFDRKMMVELFRVGIPIGMAYLFETGLFFTVTVLMGVLSTEALTAHNAVLNVCAVTFMIPYALSQAATVRVGYAVGAGQPDAARRAGYVAVWLGIGWMMLAAAAMLIAPGLLIWIYMDLSVPANASAAQLAASLFVIAAIFQIVDGTQVTTQGALRGLKDTTVPMVICGLGYWVFGLGSGVAMGFWMGFGAKGLWWGLAVGLAVSATLLFLRWRRLSGRLIA